MSIKYLKGRLSDVCRILDLRTLRSCKGLYRYVSENLNGFSILQNLFDFFFIKTKVKILILILKSLMKILAKNANICYFLGYFKNLSQTNSVEVKTHVTFIK